MKNTVELVGHYGGDETHALSAWTSTRRELDDGRRDRIGPMLKMLAGNKHHTPFEKSFLHFVVTCDVATNIHILKHRIGVSVNGESARYKEFKEDRFYIPDDWPDNLKDILRRHVDFGYAMYHSAVKQLESEGRPRKRAKESARFFLPYAIQTTMDVAFNFRSFMHFLELRTAEDAQREVRMLAFDMLAAVRATDAFNLSLAAFGWDDPTPGIETRPDGTPGLTKEAEAGMDAAMDQRFGRGSNG